MLCIVGIAAFYRFFRLSVLPPGLNPDEAMNGNDALSSLSSGRLAVFYPENYGREGLFIWIVALSLRLFGVSVEALRIPSAICGTLTVAAVYLLASQLYCRRIAVLSGLLTAVSFWHVNFSRMSLRGILVPLVMSLAFGLLLRGLRTRSVPTLLVAGALFGLGAYTYIAFRAAFLLLAALLLLAPRETWPAASGARCERVPGVRWWPLGAFLVAVGIVAAPLVSYSLREPDVFSSRVRHVSILAAKDPGLALWRSSVLTGGMFFLRGDGNPRHSPQKAPVLPLAVSPFFALGVVTAVKRAAIRRRGGREDASRASPLSEPRRAAFMLLWIVIMALPAVLSGRGLPHALRSIGMLPAVFILAASGLAAAGDALGRLDRRAPIAFVSCLVGIAALQGFRTYFVQWGSDPLVRMAFRQDLVEKAAYLRTLSPDSEAYLIANGRGLPVPYPNGFPMAAQTLIFLLHGDCCRPAPRIACPAFVWPSALDRLNVDPHRRNVFMLLRDDAPEAREVPRRFPHGVWYALKDTSVYVWPR